jgi:micrococcal nuclease
MATKCQCAAGDYTQVKVRLAWIDCPENGQPFSARGNQSLLELVFDKDLKVSREDRDR